MFQDRDVWQTIQQLHTTPTRLTWSLAFKQSQASLGEVLGEFRNFLETVRNFQIPSQLIKQTLINQDAQKNECNVVKAYLKNISIRKKFEIITFKFSRIKPEIMRWSHLRQDLDKRFLGTEKISFSFVFNPSWSREGGGGIILGNIDISSTYMFTFQYHEFKHVFILRTSK